MKLCFKCRKKKPLKEFGSNKASKDKLQTYCKYCWRSYTLSRYYVHRDRYLKSSSERKFLIRLELIKILGGKCVKCGSINLYHLQVEHKNDDAHKDRNKHGKINYEVYKEYLKGVRHIKRLQVMCANCNIEKQLRQYRFFPTLVEKYGL